MKKLALAIIITLTIVSGAYAQEATPPKQPTLDQLNAQSLYLQGQLDYAKRLKDGIDSGIINLSVQLNELQTKIKAMTPAPIPKPDDKSPITPKDKPQPKK